MFTRFLNHQQHLGQIIMLHLLPFPAPAVKPTGCSHIIDSPIRKTLKKGRFSYPPKFNSSPLKSYRDPIEKWSSNHHFSGAMLNFAGVINKPSSLLLFWGSHHIFPTCFVGEKNEEKETTTAGVPKAVLIDSVGGCTGTRKSILTLVVNACF